jgi:hypothetical protein
MPRQIRLNSVVLKGQYADNGRADGSVTQFGQGSPYGCARTYTYMLYMFLTCLANGQVSPECLGASFAPDSLDE